MIALQWSQVHAWRLAQHGLAPRFSSQDFIQAVTHAGGIQAQVMSAAELALQEMVRRYLRAYGPATADDFRFWWGCSKTLAKTLFQSLEEDLEEVEVEGWRAFVLRPTIPQIQRAEPVEHIHLLPLFDAYTIGVPRDCEPLLAPTYKRRVFNLQGWTFAVILINGSIQGVWHSTVRRGQTVITVSLFSPSTASIRSGIGAEAERLSHLFGKQVVLEYEDALAVVDV